MEGSVIWGSKRHAKEAAERRWHEWFAWKPVHLVDGRWAWLTAVDRCRFLARHIPPNVPFSTFGWCYREIGGNDYPERAI
jgi:hypothetical protein